MMHKTILVLLFFAASTFAADAETAAAKQYKALLEAYEEEGGARLFAKQFLEFATEHADDPAATDALLWVIKNVKGRPDTTKALDMLKNKHIQRKVLDGEACLAIASSRSPAAEKVLRVIGEKHPQKEVRGQAFYALAALLELEANLASQLKDRPELAPQVVQYYGKDYGNHLLSLKAGPLEKRREEVFEHMLKSFPDITFQDNKLGELAKRMLFRIRHLSVGKVAPDISGKDIQGEEFKLSDYRGKIVMLTFWGHW